MSETPNDNRDGASLPDDSNFSDAATPIDALKKLVADFVDERRWNSFHTPKNLAASVAIEAAELMEHFQWLTPEESYAVKNDPAKKAAIAEEIADVLSYLLNLSDRLDVDVASAFAAKMRKNARKYPTNLFRGVYGVDDPALNRAKLVNSSSVLPSDEERNNRQ